MRFPLKIATSSGPQMWFIIITSGQRLYWVIYLYECQLSINRITPGVSILRIVVPTDLQMWFVLLLELVMAVSDYMVIWNASLTKIDWDSNNNACKEKIGFLITWDSCKYSVSKFERFLNLPRLINYFIEIFIIWEWCNICRHVLNYL